MPLLCQSVVSRTGGAGPDKPCAARWFIWAGALENAIFMSELAPWFIWAGAVAYLGRRRGLSGPARWFIWVGAIENAILRSELAPLVIWAGAVAYLGRRRGLSGPARWFIWAGALENATFVSKRRLPDGGAPAQINHGLSGPARPFPDKPCQKCGLSSPGILVQIKMRCPKQNQEYSSLQVINIGRTLVMSPGYLCYVMNTLAHTPGVSLWLCEYYCD